MSLTEVSHGEHSESIVSAIEELDRLAEFLNTSLDVAEAKADALRLTRTQLDLDQLLRSMIDLYEPCMSERGLQIQFHSVGALIVEADAALIHRMIANLLDNELKHLRATGRVRIELRAVDNSAQLILEDNGPGFSEEVLPHLFEQRVKGKESKGHGLGLTFVEAVARTHGGAVAASNLRGGGAQIMVTIPLNVNAQNPPEKSAPLLLAAE
jgi:signal transduction histidine kinase